MIKSNEDFVWSIEVPLSGKFIIDVDFLDLKIAGPDVYAQDLSFIIIDFLLYSLQMIII